MTITLPRSPYWNKGRLLTTLGDKRVVCTCSVKERHSVSRQPCYQMGSCECAGNGSMLNTVLVILQSGWASWWHSTPDSFGVSLGHCTCHTYQLCLLCASSTCLRALRLLRYNSCYLLDSDTMATVRHQSCFTTHVSLWCVVGWHHCGPADLCQAANSRHARHSGLPCLTSWR